tara:strand:- start:837 stop:1103 length:267 start_codon:yes stop_codon:yes gene_type:complete
MNNELEVNDTIIRKGTMRETYSIKEKKFVNNILHYIIRSNNSNDIILSEYAIEKDFISSKKYAQNNEKRNFIELFKKQIKKILPLPKK